MVTITTRSIRGFWKSIIIINPFGISTLHYNKNVRIYTNCNSNPKKKHNNQTHIIYIINGSIALIDRPQNNTASTLILDANGHT